VSVRDFEVMLNALVSAAQADDPSAEGYGAKRRAVVDYVRGLERRQTMYRQPGRKTWQVDVRDDRGGRKPGCSTGCAERGAARAVEAMLVRFAERRQWEPLRAIVDGRVTLAEVYDADVRGTLPALLETRAAVDLDPLVDAWARAGARASAVVEVRRFIPGPALPGHGVPPRRHLGVARRTLERAHEGHGALAARRATATRRRSAFAAFLVEREVLEANPTRDVAAYAESDPRMVFLTLTQARRSCRRSRRASRRCSRRSWRTGSSGARSPARRGVSWTCRPRCRRCTRSRPTRRRRARRSGGRAWWS
jgi:hypothetical protein